MRLAKFIDQISVFTHQWMCTWAVAIDAAHHKDVPCLVDIAAEFDISYVGKAFLLTSSLCHYDRRILFLTEFYFSSVF